MLATIQAKDGQVLTSLDIPGSYGIPTINWTQGGDSLSHDGRLLVLGKTQPTSPSAFLVYDPRSFRLKQRIALPGNFSFDALSPDGTRMYLVQHTRAASGDYAHYVVRAYDLRTKKLLPGRIADRTQRSWVMNGYPLTRVSSADGRWVYTLYQNGGDGYPFVHALDTVRGVAHCIGLPMTNGLYNLVLSLHGSTLAVHWLSGRPWYANRHAHVARVSCAWRRVSAALGLDRRRGCARGGPGGHRRSPARTDRRIRARGAQPAQRTGTRAGGVTNVSRPHGSGSAVLNRDFHDPDGFTTATRIPIDAAAGPRESAPI